MSLLRVRLQAITRASRLCYAARRTYSDMDHDTAGSIRSAGGAWGKKEKAIEDQYFHNLETEQLAKMKKEAAEHHEEEITHHEDAISDLQEQIKRHQDKIERHKKKMAEHKD